MLKAIIAYAESDPGKQYSSKISSLLESNKFKEALYYLILASKINKIYKQKYLDTNGKAVEFDKEVLNTKIDELDNRAMRAQILTE